VDPVAVEGQRRVAEQRDHTWSHDPLPDSVGRWLGAGCDKMRRGFGEDSEDEVRILRVR